MFVIKRKKSNIDLIFILALFGVFMISALFIVLFGAQIYQKQVNTQEDNFTQRTVVAYITEKIQKNDCAHSIQIYTADGVDTLRLANSSENGIYYTYLYFYEGQLQEFTAHESAPFDKSYGSPVMELVNLSMRQDKSTFYFEATDKDDNVIKFNVTTRTDNSISEVAGLSELESQTNTSLLFAHINLGGTQND